jgi:ferredoxin
MVTIDKNKCDGDGTCAHVPAGGVQGGGAGVAVNMSECITADLCGGPQQAITVNEL